MNLSNINKVKALGMPFGTANGKLRKSILFHLVQKIELDLCFRCNKIIASIEDFSIEHKIAWMGTNDPVKYFFDIENIAFSHIICNNKAGLKRGSPGHIPPNKRRVKNDAVSWCYKCAKDKPLLEFSKNSSKQNGVQSECRDCRKADRSE